MTQTTLETTTTAAGLPQVSDPRNPGMALDMDWVMGAQANTSAIERRCATLPGRRTVKKEYQAAWLARAISCIDLTTLAGDDTPGRVRRLCAKAMQPVRADLLEAVGLPKLTTGAVCVYHEMVPVAVEALAGSGIPVAAVSTGFPAGLSPYHLRVNEIEESVKAGAEEIDIVISRRHVLTGNWQALYDEMKEFREACGEAHVKAILATGELGTLRNVARASLVCMMAGADFIKTSTGKESVNATLPVSLVMIRAIRAYQQATGYRVGYKPAGGISKAKDSLVYLSLMKEELGDRWLRPDLFRFGASSLLGDIERQLEHHVTGAYSASWRHAMA
ncbi:deoxyribose-phosphate aldolase [Nioella sp.]|uniref:deoxyribose-phosphate aldolase n=1 Tax=Nioella sp. TaxID=1912091 RepID=UPI003B5229CE